MKQFLTLITCAIFAVTMVSCSTLKRLPKSTQEIDNVVTTMYKSISGDTLTERDWALFVSLFHENAELNYTTTSKEGKTEVISMTPQQYADRGKVSFKKFNFNEIELHRVIEVFGKVAHSFSTYQTTYESHTFKRVKKGINSIQLVYDGNNWLITSITWSDGTEENPVPKWYLP